jgi:hypothetical protein
MHLSLNELSDDERFTRFVQDCESKMISFYGSGEDDERNTRDILRFYYGILDSEDGIPSLEEIMEWVYDHNTTLVWMIAEAQYEMEGWHGPNETEDSREETISMLCEPWEENYSDHLYSNLEMYVEDILEEEKLSYTYQPEHCQYEHLELHGNVEIVINDCQNILFPSFAKYTWEGCSRGDTQRLISVISK